MYRLVVLMCLLPFPALAALGPSTPPTGVSGEAWKQMTGRAEWVAKSVSALAPKSNKHCVYAVVLELLGEIEASSSQDTSPLRESSRTVAKGKVKAFKDELRRNSEKECGDGDGGSGSEMANTVRGLLRFAAQESEWDVANYEHLKENVMRAAQGMVLMGVFGSSAAYVVPAAASVSLPMLDPRLFIPKRNDPRGGT